MEWGLLAEACRCRSTSVHIDVRQVQQKLGRIKEARRMAVQFGAASAADYDALCNAPLSLDLINDFPVLLEALERANAEAEGGAGASGLRTMAARPLSMTAGNTAASAISLSSEDASVPEQGAGEEDEEEEEEEDGEDDDSADDAPPVDDDFEEVEYHEDCIPEGVSVRLRCGYDDCDGQFRSTQTLIKHYQTVHSGPTTSKDTASSRRSSSGRGGRRRTASARGSDDSEEDVPRRRSAGRGKRRRPQSSDDDGSMEEQAEDAGDIAITKDGSTMDLSIREVLRRKADQLRLSDRWKRTTDPVTDLLAAKGGVVEERKEAAIDVEAEAEAEVAAKVLPARRSKVGKVGVRSPARRKRSATPTSLLTDDTLHALS